MCGIQGTIWEIVGTQEPTDVVLALTDKGWEEVAIGAGGTTKEKPKEPIKSKLSDILQHNVDPKYRLSEKACLGILRRAENRGKELPKVLKDALLSTAGIEEGDYTFSKTSHPRNKDEGQGWKESDTAHTLNLFNMGEIRADELIVQ